MIEPLMLPEITITPSEQDIWEDTFEAHMRAFVQRRMENSSNNFVRQYARGSIKQGGRRSNFNPVSYESDFTQGLNKMVNNSLLFGFAVPSMVILAPTLIENEAILNNILSRGLPKLPFISRLASNRLYSGFVPRGNFTTSLGLAGINMGAQFFGRGMVTYITGGDELDYLKIPSELDLGDSFFVGMTAYTGQARWILLGGTFLDVQLRGVRTPVGAYDFFPERPWRKGRLQTKTLAETGVDAFGSFFSVYAG